MKMSFNEAGTLYNSSLFDDIQLCERYGYDYIEIEFDKLRSYLSRYSVYSLKKYFEASHIKPYAINTKLVFNFKNSIGHAELKDKFRFICEAASILDCHQTIVIPNCDIGNYTIDDIHHESVDKLSEIAEIGKMYHMNVGLEVLGMPNCCINTFGQGYDIIKAVNMDNVGIVLDAFHFHSMGSRWEDLERTDPKKIFGWHLSDCRNYPVGSIRDADHVWIGEGAVNLDRMCTIMKQIGYNNIASIESFSNKIAGKTNEKIVERGKERMLDIVGTYFDFD